MAYATINPYNGQLLKPFPETTDDQVNQALDDAHGNQSRAARILSTTRDRLRYKMKKYGLDEQETLLADAAEA